MSGPLGTLRKLDYVPRLDPRNLAHRVSAAPAPLLKTSRYWTGGVVLDQGQEGSCVGHGVTAEYLASPVRGTPWKYYPSSLSEADGGHELAVRVYEKAKTVDEWEGVDYEGTSVRAGMLVARQLGWIDSFRWALNIAELRNALELGPVVIGFEVRDSMFNPAPNGDWIPMGLAAGGHCALVTGYSPDYSRRGPRFRIRNSWGLDWGSNGNVYISPSNLDSILFASGGEAAVAVGRHL